MLFNSAPFLFGFLPVALCGYFAVARRGNTVALCWLTCVSLVFYGWSNPGLIPVLLGSVVGNHGIARLLAATSERPRTQAWILRLGVTINILALGYCKYLEWLAGLINATGLLSITPPSIALPLGISFLTFTQIGYLIDVRDGTATARNVLGYAVFVTFFPHLIAGPVLQAREIAPQLADPATRRFSAGNLSIGLAIFSVGLAKKTLLADPLAPGITAGFANAAALPLFEAWHAALGYSLQLYFDFSGYSDMAIGLARMFNIRFPLNFDSPYKATSVIDYWQRWHMTLTRWLTRTIYSPLSLAVMRRRIARGRQVNQAAQRTLSGFAAMSTLPIFVTFGLAGLWHGSGAQFIVFGLLHAMFLTINRAWRMLRGRPEKTRGFGAIWRVLLTYGCVLVASVFFRADDLPQAMDMLAGMVGLHGIGAGLPLPAGIAHALAGTTWLPAWFATVIHAADGREMMQSGRQIGCLVALYVVVWGLPNTQQIFARAQPALEAVEPGWFIWRPTLPWAFGLGGLGMLGMLAMGGTGEFLYFRF